MNTENSNFTLLYTYTIIIHEKTLNLNITTINLK